LLSLQTGKDRKTHLLEEEEEISAAADILLSHYAPETFKM